MTNRTTRSSASRLEFEMGKGVKAAQITQTAYEKVKKERNTAVKAMEESSAKLKIVESEKEKLLIDLDALKTAQDTEKLEMKDKLDSEVERWQYKYYKIKQKHIDDKSKFATLLSEKVDIESQLEDLQNIKAGLDLNLADSHSKYESLNSINVDLQNQVASLRQENIKLTEEVAKLTTKVENLQKSKKIVEEKKRLLLKDLLSYKDAVLLSKLKSDGVYLPRRQTRYYDSDEELTSRNYKYDDRKHRDHPKPYDGHRGRPKYY